MEHHDSYRRVFKGAKDLFSIELHLKVTYVSLMDIVMVIDNIIVTIREL